jgi:hypothetical protein
MSMIIHGMIAIKTKNSIYSIRVSDDGFIVEKIKAIENVQQSKTQQKRRGDRALNQKRSKIFGVENNCETASISMESKSVNVGDKFIGPNLTLKRGESDFVRQAQNDSSHVSDFGNRKE